LQGAEDGRVGVQQQRAEQPLHPGHRSVQLGLGVAADRHIQPDADQPPLPGGQPPGQPLRVVGGHRQLGVVQAALGGVQPLGGFQAGELAAQSFGGYRCGHRLHMQGHVDGAGVVQ
jgi:hypothetical protein